MLRAPSSARLCASEPLRMFGIERTSRHEWRNVLHSKEKQWFELAAST
jgi:hypothetical protein